MNAIILAAGLGSRFKDITKKTHKALLPIDGIPNIERTIRYLKEAKIDNIYIVTGHLASQFEYLVEKYQCTLIYNPKYQEYNSIYSFYLASSYFGDSFVIDCDVVLFDNIFKDKTPEKSFYYLIKRPKSEAQEWVPLINEQNKITEIEISNREEFSLLGISFWNKKDALLIKESLKDFLKENLLSESSLYWDNIPMQLLPKLTIEAEKIKLSQAYEMDKLEDYNLIINKQLQ